MKVLLRTAREPLDQRDGCRNAGRYDVTVERRFRTSEERDVALNGSETVRLNVVLDLGAVSDRVTVQAQVPQVETEQGRVSGNIETRELKQLPLNGRNLYSLLALQPGVSGRGLAAFNSRFRTH